MLDLQHCAEVGQHRFDLIARWDIYFLHGRLGLPFEQVGRRPAGQMQQLHIGTVHRKYPNQRLPHAEREELIPGRNRVPCNVR